MAKEIQLGPNSRLVVAKSVRLGGPRAQGPKIDFARDHVIFIDESGRPVAECRPVEEPAPAPPKPAAPPPAAAEEVSASRDRLGPKGPLSDAQRETLERVWKEHPNWTSGEVIKEFEKRAGRTVSSMTVNAYRPT